METTRHARLLYTAVSDFLLERETLGASELVCAYTKEVWELTLVVSGFGLLTAAGRTLAFSSGDVILVAPHVPCRWDFSPVTYSGEDSHAERLCLSVNETFLRNLYSSNPYMTNVGVCSDASGVLVKFSSAASLRISQVLLRMETESRAMQAADILRLVVIGMESDEAQKAPAQDATAADDDGTDIGKVYKFIKMNAWRSITLDEVSRHMSMSKSTFCAFFRKNTGSSFVSYLDGYRIDAACVMLTRDPSRSVSDICFETGFNSVSYFNRVFKKYKGVSPTVYRRSHANP